MDAEFMVSNPSLNSSSGLKSHHLSAVLTAAPEIFEWTETEFLSFLKDSVQNVGLKAVGELAFTFEPQGISAVVLLEESHIALHFWPEKGKISVDIHVCDYQQNNRNKAEKLAQLLTLNISGNGNSDSWHYLAISG
ncbi:S-adenosylmethionine decarboxylase family protein [Leptolyngbya sp. FACHB-261]|uniref:S-adenosylmethionine decarboxylase family protein n=1 Tax=Leptolyngbya sp. FACHB-261 TaxID=2692806 RepID=UPI001688ECDA|nr:S-adenosylmethionine decarboxylase [Leptolyngbya sp. FACHB-261]MBD2103629.1 S-adenosylmethionine decarboxylase [Leptolyngbya sp. FACHB-261]